MWMGYTQWSRYSQLCIFKWNRLSNMLPTKDAVKKKESRKPINQGIKIDVPDKCKAKRKPR